MNTPEVLYKYYKDDDVYNEHRLGGELFFATPIRFNDIYDCQFVGIKNNTNKVSRDKVLKIIGECGYVDKDVDEIYGKLLKDDDATIRDIYNKQQGHLGILCLTNTNTNMPMWGLYTNNKGYCIEYDLQKINIAMNNQFPSLVKQKFWDPTKRIIQNEVTYIDCLDEPKLFLESLCDAYQKYWCKLNQWSFEQEYRIGVSLGGDKTIEAQESVKAIYFGTNMTNERISELIELCPKEAKRYKMRKGIKGLMAEEI